MWLRYIKNREHFLKSLEEKDKEWQWKIIKASIDKISQYTDTITIRKSNQFPNNYLIGSQVQRFWKEYHILIDERTNVLPFNKDIYRWKDILDKVDNLLQKSNNILMKSYLDHLKNYIILITYFPNILEYRDKNFSQYFKEDFFTYMSNIDKLSEKEIIDNQGLINHYLFSAESHDEIRALNMLEDLMRSYYYKGKK